MLKFIKRLLCRHYWDYGESSQYSFPKYRWCVKCHTKQKYHIDGGCHGSAWWATYKSPPKETE